jgi:sialate O-acetylesterase
MRLFSVWSPESESFGKTPRWVECSPGVLGEFSAAAYFFGRYLQNELKVPVGLIHNSMGGSAPEAWMKKETLLADPEFSPIVSYWDSLAKTYPGSMETFDTWLAKLHYAKAKGFPLPETPSFAFAPKPHRIYMRHPQILRDAQLVPLIPYSMAGVIWYQGETNTDRSYQYRRLFPAMIREWRDAWGQGDFPFIYVQLANYTNGSPEISIPELREAQLMALKTPNTAMAVTIDIGDDDNVHANNKWEVGRRLALAALHDVYGREIVSSGPVYREMKKEKGAIRLVFDHADGLAAKGGKPDGFAIAGTDRKFHTADARIEGNTVVVSGRAVPDPAAVRYGWENCPPCNLYNAAGLPASPFRTDSWPGVTEGRLQQR